MSFIDNNGYWIWVCCIIITIGLRFMVPQNIIGILTFYQQVGFFGLPLLLLIMATIISFTDGIIWKEGTDKDTFNRPVVNTTYFYFGILQFILLGGFVAWNKYYTAETVLY